MHMRLFEILLGLSSDKSTHLHVNTQLCIEFRDSMPIGHLSVYALVCGFHPVCRFLRIQDGVWGSFSFLWQALVTGLPCPLDPQ